MVGVEHQLHAPAPVLVVELGVSVVVADQGAAPDAFYGEDTEVDPRAVVGQVAGLLGSIPRAEHLVVAIHDPAAVVDDVEAVVGLVWGRQSVR